MIKRASRLLWLLGALALLATMAGLTSPAEAASRQEAGDPEAFTTLTLQNGWAPYDPSSGVPRVRLSHGIVEFKGAMSGGSVPAAFVLPPSMRPTRKVFIPVGLCDALNGRLVIKPDGTTRAEAGTTFSDASCFTSLDGASFALNPAGPVALPLINGWIGNASGTRSAAAALVDGVVHLSGALRTNGTDRHPFVVPVGMRPAATIFVPIDVCSARDGRLRITSSGIVSVQAQGSFDDAGCFTSLDGASWVVNPSSHTVLTLQNGWGGQPYHTRTPRAAAINGVVRFSGAFGYGTNTGVFTLPVGLRPPKQVYIQVDLCGAANGRLIIDTDGNAFVESEDIISDAECFTSLEGASFAL